MSARDLTAEENRLKRLYERLRDRLLDMRLSNPMLNYRHGARSKRQLQIVDEVPENVYRRLAISEDFFVVSSLPEPEGSPADEQTEDFRAAFEHARISDAEFVAEIEKLEQQGLDGEDEIALAETQLRIRLRKKLGMPPRPDRKTVNPAEHARSLGIDPSIELQASSEAAQHRDGTLQTLKWPEVLQATLEKITADARLAEQEMGLSTLFLVFGFLEWLDSKDSEKRLHAPLLLLPVVLEREKSARGKIVFKLRAAANVPDANLSLAKKLESLDVLLPDFAAEETDKAPIESYFAAVSEAVADKPGWRVRRWLTLGHFAFGRLAMYTDLAPENWRDNPVKSDLVSAVLRGSEISGDGGVNLSHPPDDHDIDLPEIEKEAPYLIYDADASQHSATIDVMKGANLVIQGPPGTGKSQTIANIIANALAAKKKVLFLAEKMAALEVVKRRLDAVDLGHFCLELHSDKSSPRQVIQSLKQRHELGYRSLRERLTDDPTWNDARRDIQRYLDALHAERDVGKPFDQFWHAIRVRETQGQNLAAFRKRPFPSRIVDDAAEADALFGELRQYAKVLTDFEVAFGKVSASKWSSLAFLGDPNPGMAFGLIDALQSLAVTAKGLLAICDECAPLAVRTIEELHELEKSDRFLAADVPPGHVIASLSVHEQSEVQSFLAALDDEAQAESSIQEIDGFDTVDPTARALVRSVADRLSEEDKGKTPAETLDEAAFIRANVQRLRDALEHARPALDRLKLPESFPAAGLNALLVAAMYLRRVPIETRELAFGQRRVEAAELATAVAEWRELSKAEQQWRTRFSSHVGPWPAVDSLYAAETARRKSGISGLIARLGAEGKTLAAVNVSLGLPPTINLSADDYRDLADHTRKISGFGTNKTYARLFGSYWRGIETDVESIVGDLSLCGKIFELLPHAPGGDVVHQMLDTATREDLEALAFSFNDLNPWSKLDHDARRLVGSATVASMLSHLNVRQEEAAFWLALDPEGKLGKVKGTWSELVANVEATESIEKLRAVARAHPLADLRDLFTSEREAIKAAIAWLTELDRIEMPALLRELLRSEEAQRVRRELAGKVASAQSKLLELRTEIDAIRTSYGVTISTTGTISDLVAQIDDLAGRRDELAQFLAVRSMRGRLEKAGLAAHLQLADGLGIEPGEIPDLLEGVLAQHRAEELRRSDPVLSATSGMMLEAKRNDFAKRDHAKKDRDRKHVYNAVIGNQTFGGSSHGSRKNWTESALLSNEFGKQKSFFPVRDLMRRAGRSIQSLKPCFMMSPLSLAKFLPAQSLTFDLLVIDEASQMRPEDALGGLLRARQVVVVGDPKQLPPTDFFQRSMLVDGAGDDGDFDDENDESILEACHKTFRQFRLLRWHYRSRCESLISFSNKAIYEPDGRRLITFPAAKPGSFSIDRIRVRGYFQANCNPTEAQRMAEEAVRFMKEHADLEEPPTIGLVAMNGPQTELIKEELRLLETGDEAVERYREKVERLGEPLFVKNLENVQGDERDFILISMTYGPRPNEQSVLQRFGPITGKQGHRRLNVLFTRARVGIGLVTSMDASDIRPAATSSQGVHMLQSYLSYVEQGGREQGVVTGREADSDFELHVADLLRARGYETVPQVGVSGFRIDLGILHPKHPGHFLAGIECDGAQYHSSKSARDRDRLRQEVLEGLGWKILRVWSTDWFDNPRRQASLLADRLDALVDAPLRGGKFTFQHAVDVEISPSTIAMEGNQTDLDLNVSEAASDLQTALKQPAPSMPTASSVPETRSEPWKNSNLSPAEAKMALAAFRDAMIAPTFENWEPERSILRSGLIETFVEQRVLDDADWFSKVPNYLRRNTNAAEKKQFFEDICDVIARIR